MSIYGSKRETDTKRARSSTSDASSSSTLDMKQQEITKPLFRRLPDAVARYLFGYLPLESLGGLAQSSRKTRDWIRARVADALSMEVNLRDASRHWAVLARMLHQVFWTYSGSDPHAQISAEANAEVVRRTLAANAATLRDVRFTYTAATTAMLPAIALCSNLHTLCLHMNSGGGLGHYDVPILVCSLRHLKVLRVGVALPSDSLRLIFRSGLPLGLQELELRMDDPRPLRELAATASQRDALETIFFELEEKVWGGAERWMEELAPVLSKLKNLRDFSVDLPTSASQDDENEGKNVLLIQEKKEMISRRSVWRCSSLERLYIGNWGCDFISPIDAPRLHTFTCQEMVLSPLSELKMPALRHFTIESFDGDEPKEIDTKSPEVIAMEAASEAAFLSSIPEIVSIEVIEGQFRWRPLSLRTALSLHHLQKLSVHVRADWGGVWLRLALHTLQKLTQLELVIDGRRDGNLHVALDTAESRTWEALETDFNVTPSIFVHSQLKTLIVRAIDGKEVSKALTGIAFPHLSTLSLQFLDDIGSGADALEIRALLRNTPRLCNLSLAIAHHAPAPSGEGKMEMVAHDGEPIVLPLRQLHLKGFGWAPLLYQLAAGAQETLTTVALGRHIDEMDEWGWGGRPGLSTKVVRTDLKREATALANALLSAYVTAKSCATTFDSRASDPVLTHLYLGSLSLRSCATKKTYTSELKNILPCFEKLLDIMPTLHLHLSDHCESVYASIRHTNIVSTDWPMYCGLMLNRFVL